MKILKTILLLLFCVFFVRPSAADEYVWINEISFFSEYYSRGISQTMELPAPQLLSIVSNIDHGFYGGVFASRVEFNDNDEADQEVDFFFGINKFVENWSYRGGIIYYTYPNADEDLGFNFFEFDFAVGYNFDPIYLEASLKYSPDYFFDTGNQTYSKLALRSPITEKLGFEGHVAYRQVEDDVRFGVPDNFDWEAGLVYSIVPEVEFSAKYVDSSFSETECADICNERIITGITYKF